MSGSSAPTLRSRYVSKVLAGGISMGFSVCTQVLVPKSLGPEFYGAFGFITNFFTQLASFLDVGASLGFYTKLSQRPRDRSLVAFFSWVTLTICGAILGVVAVARLLRLETSIWPGMSLHAVYLGAAWGVLYWISQVVGRMADAYGLTIRAEVVKTFQKGFAFAALWALILWKGRLGLDAFFYYNYLNYAVLVLGFGAVIRASGHFVTGGLKVSVGEARRHAADFYAYTHPLAMYAFVGFAAGLVDRWLLQYFGGNLEQSFFTLGSQVSVVCFIFSGAMTPLIHREFSISFGAGDVERIAQLFRRNIPLLYSVAAYLSCFVAFQAPNIAAIIGKDFGRAVLPVAVMALYPIHQTYGQLCGSLFYATGRTRLYRNIGIFFSLLGIPVTYFLIAPRAHHGLQAGALGLALKTVVIQFLAVNAQLFFNLRLFRGSFFKYLGHQGLSVGVLLILAWGASLLTARTLGGLAPTARFTAAGALYTAVVAAAMLSFPPLFGLTREDFKRRAAP